MELSFAIWTGYMPLSSLWICNSFGGAAENGDRKYHAVFCIWIYSRKSEDVRGGLIIEAFPPLSGVSG